MVYNGNQLEAVEDMATASVYNNGFEFRNGVSSEVEYFYDANGNLTKDLNKNILDIQYNFLNLPRRITLVMVVIFHIVMMQQEKTSDSSSGR